MPDNTLADLSSGGSGQDLTSSIALGEGFGWYSEKISETHDGKIGSL